MKKISATLNEQNIVKLYKVQTRTKKSNESARPPSLNSYRSKSHRPLNYADHLTHTRYIKTLHDQTYILPYNNTLLPGFMFLLFFCKLTIRLQNTSTTHCIKKQQLATISLSNRSPTYYYYYYYSSKSFSKSRVKK